MNEKQIKELLEENKLLREVLEKCPMCKCERYPFSEKARKEYKKCLRCQVLKKGVIQQGVGESVLE